MTEHFSRAIAMAIVLLSAAVWCFSQEGAPQRRAALQIDLLAMKGSSTNLSENGEGVHAVRSSLLFKEGPTRVHPVDPSFKLELPVGYTLQGNLTYVIESEAIATGPHLISLRLPSAGNQKIFDKLRILHADRNDAEPDKARWSDVTVDSDYFPLWESHFTKTEFEKLLPDPAAHSLNAVSRDLGLFVVAILDPAVARYHFLADVGVIATAKPEAVMEGRELEYLYKIDNAGPDQATEVRFHTFFGVYPISFEASQGRCRYDAGNLYCNLGDLAKGAVATVTIKMKCPWRGPRREREDTEPLGTSFDVVANEGDTNLDNNMLSRSTPVLPDSNKEPELRILSPTEGQFLAGQAPLRVVISARDPDGRLDKVEIFDQGKLIGEAKEVAQNRYELPVEKLAYGLHVLTAIATDDQGRQNYFPARVSFIVNGQADIEILSPKPNTVIGRAGGPATVKVRATNPNGSIKRVAVSILDLTYGHGGGSGFVLEATAADKDVYESKIEALPCISRCKLEASVTDDQGAETLSAAVVFKVATLPNVSLLFDEGHGTTELPNGAILERAPRMELLAKAFSLFDRTNSIAKVVFYANEKAVCSVTSGKEQPDSRFGIFRCDVAGLPSGKYKLVAVATDSDGTEGKSAPIEVAIR